MVGARRVDLHQVLRGYRAVALPLHAQPDESPHRVGNLPTDEVVTPSDRYQPGGKPTWASACCAEAASEPSATSPTETPNWHHARPVNTCAPAATSSRYPSPSTPRYRSR